MDQDENEIAAQARRCRRIASQMTDDEIRQSLEELAREYEERLAERGGAGEGFMFQKQAARQSGSFPSTQASARSRSSGSYTR